MKKTDKNNYDLSDEAVRQERIRCAKLYDEFALVAQGTESAECAKYLAAKIRGELTIEENI